MLVRVAILLSTVAPQAWSLEVGSAAHEAPSLLQGAYQTLASVEAPVVDAEEHVENELQKLDNVVDKVMDSQHLDSLHEFGGDENSDEETPLPSKKGDEHLDEVLLDSKKSDKESYEGYEEDLYNDALKPRKGDDMTGENATHQFDISSPADSFSQLQHLDIAQEESKEDSDEGLDETQLGTLQPEKGDEMPKFPRSFPGCGCDYSDIFQTWSCKGSIAHPASLQGNDCCCCTLACERSNRCTNEQCLLIGIDQKAEIAAEEARRAALLKDADALLGNLPVYKVALGVGRPNGLKIDNACKAKKMIPLCDSYAYRKFGCYHPGGIFAKPSNWHFSVPHQMLPLGVDPRQFYGMAFYYNRNNQPHGGALVANGMSHNWVTHMSNPLSINDMTTKQRIQAIPISEVDSGKSLGGWHTYCVKEKATR